MVCLFYVFFFQAEDGIRDGHVTGVQTCALPILPMTMRAILSTSGSGESPAMREPRAKTPTPMTKSRPRPKRSPARPAATRKRSEERRVGKEGRGGGWAETYKKRGEKGAGRAARR